MEKKSDVVSNGKSEGKSDKPASTVDMKQDGAPKAEFPTLPIHAYATEIVELVRKNQISVITGDTVSSMYVCFSSWRRGRANRHKSPSFCIKRALRPKGS
jgi:hypothetical protein